MFELKKVGDNTFYYTNHSKSGLYRINDTDVCLIDGGSEDVAGRRLLNMLKARKWNLTAIYNTHAHSDHIGGNNLIQKQTGCKIYGYGVESAFTNYSILEPSMIYSTNPPRELRTKIVMAKSSKGEELKPELLPQGLEMIPIPGHSNAMVAFRTDDDVVFLGDLLATKKTLDAVGITYIYHVENHLNSLELVKNMDARLFIPAHGPLLEGREQMVDLVQYNIDKVNAFADFVLEQCRTPMYHEELLQRVLLHFNVRMTFPQYFLMGSTVRSYFTYLHEQGRLDWFFENGLMYWKTI